MRGDAKCIFYSYSAYRRREVKPKLRRKFGVGDVKFRQLTARPYSCVIVAMCAKFIHLRRNLGPGYQYQRGNSRPDAGRPRQSLNTDGSACQPPRIKNVSPRKVRVQPAILLKCQRRMTQAPGGNNPRILANSDGSDARKERHACLI